jgi:hypothetical protein
VAARQQCTLSCWPALNEEAAAISTLQRPCSPKGAAGAELEGISPALPFDTPAAHPRLNPGPRPAVFFIITKGARNVVSLSWEQGAWIAAAVAGGCAVLAAAVGMPLLRRSIRKDDQ